MTGDPPPSTIAFVPRSLVGGAVCARLEPSATTSVRPTPIRLNVVLIATSTSSGTRGYCHLFSVIATFHCSDLSITSSCVRHTCDISSEPATLKRAAANQARASSVGRQLRARWRTSRAVGEKDTRTGSGLRRVSSVVEQDMGVKRVGLETAEAEG